MESESRFLQVHHHTQIGLQLAALAVQRQIQLIEAGVRSRTDGILHKKAVSE